MWPLHAKNNLETMALRSVVAVTFVIHVLCSLGDSGRVAVQWTQASSRDVDDMDLTLATLDSSKTSIWRRITSSKNKVPAMFIFGDSTADVGNNNYRETLAQATFWPYGMDFDTHLPTGRFCDGRLSVDFIANYLGLPLVPSFASATYFAQGANFASAGSGILSDTGSIFGEVITFWNQLQNFQTVQQVLEAELGELQASKLISESIYYISTGSNDFINNYLLPNTPHSQLAAGDFQELLLNNFTQQIRTLFKMGARKIVVVSLSPLGCLPSQLFKMGSKDGKCITLVNKLAVDYNAILAESLHRLRRHLPGAQIVYNDAYLAFSDIMENAPLYGIRHTNQSCCGTGLYGGTKACLMWTSVCQNVSDHLFWDEFHPTATAYKLIADSFWSGSLKFSSPWNVQTLASL